MHTNNAVWGGQSCEITVPGMESKFASNGGYHPEYMRVPKRRCSITGLSRSKIYEFILPSESNNYKPPVKSVSLRKPGQIKGTRLIVLKSLLDYLRDEVEAFQQSTGKEVGK